MHGFRVFSFLQGLLNGVVGVSYINGDEKRERESRMMIPSRN